MYTAVLEHHRLRIETALPQYLPVAEGASAVTAEAMAYACEAGGKRIRPVLVMEFARLCGGDAEKALPFACALEMIHSYSLVHDDLPCMDNSPLRRGRPSTHAAYGETIALLAGDGLLNRAFEVCASSQNRTGLSAESALNATAVLADAAGQDGMIGGQTIDLQSEGKLIESDILEELHRKKTGALLIAACKMGAILADADEARVAAAEAYGAHLGLAFQIVDDLLDATATAEQLGKPTGADEENKKSTYVTLYGLDGARQMAESETDAALEALSAFGEAADELRELTGALLNRPS